MYSQHLSENNNINNDETTYDVHLIHPFKMLNVGPSGCGKTHFITNLIKKRNIVFSKPPKRIIYIYNTNWQPQNFNELEGEVEFVKGLPPDFLSWFDGSYPSFVILDDMMNEAAKSDIVSDLYTKGSHHLDLSVATLCQNLFPKGAKFRDITLNSDYINLFENVRDQKQIKFFANQVSNSKKQYENFIEAYHHATSRDYGYLFCNLKPGKCGKLRLLTNILGEAPYMIAYPF